MKKFTKIMLCLTLAALLLLSGCGKNDVVVPAPLGEISGNTYTNTYAGYGCKLEGNWTLVPAEQLQELPADFREAIKDTAIGEQLSEVTRIMDVQATNTDTFANFNVLYEELTAAQRLTLLSTSEEEVIDQTLVSKDQMIEAYKAVGMDVSSMEKTTVKFLGEDRAALRTILDLNGTQMYVIQIFDSHLGGKYRVAITFTADSEENVAQMMDSFYKLG